MKMPLFIQSTQTDTSHLKQVKLYPALHVDNLVLPLTHLFGLDSLILHHAPFVSQPTEKREVFQFEGVGSIDEVRGVKVLNVIACNDVRVHFSYEVSPLLKCLSSV